MAIAGSATPLIALDAVVIDTETTGLDPGKARVIDVAGVRIGAGKLDAGGTFHSLVRPDVPIPESATKIHGIDDGAVAGAPPFEDVWPELRTQLVSAVVIGHTVGFDLTVLKRECERANLPWSRPRSLDTRLLAEIARPNLAGYALEQLADLYGIDMTQRHQALADAVTAARIFLALLPELRARGIRTLAEAEAASRALTKTLEEQSQAGWEDAIATPVRETESGLARIDSYPYRHRVRDLMSAPPKFVTATLTLETALGRMAGEKVSSLFVYPSGSDARIPPRPEDTGIVTERDAMRALARHGAGALAMPVDSAMSRPLAAVSADTFVYRAIGRMNRLKIRHLGVTDEEGRLCGALSARDLLRLRAEAAVELGDEIDEADGEETLARAWAKVPSVAGELLAEGVTGREVAAVISRELGAATARAAVIAERRMMAEGLGAPPCRYAFAVLGSAGRGESLLAMDQDNALVFAEGAPESDVDRWFERLGFHVADILNTIGVPYCKGGVMAKNPQWRGSAATWRARIGNWLGRSQPQDLLSVDIFFDLRGVHGDAALATELWRNGFEAARGERGFAKLLADAAGAVEPGLNFFRRFRTEEGRIDLKKSGLFGIVTTARVLAIAHHVVERSTPARLHGVAALGIGGASDLDALNEAHGVFLDLILGQQLEDIDKGIPPTNRVLVARLARKERERLRAALERVRHLDALTRDLLFRG
jgi:DNA polymerase-3 subunit epsilon/CBS domain-containing protein